jgi:hypothetical protein
VVSCRWAGEQVKGADAEPTVKLSELLSRMHGSDPFDSMIYQKELPASAWKSMSEFFEVRTHASPRSADVCARVDGACVPPGCEDRGRGRCMSQVPEILQEFSVDMSLSLSSATVGVPYHKHGPSWLGLVAGRKQWVIVPPAEGSAMSGQPLPCSESKGVTGELPKGAVVIMQEAGEFVYVPSDWAHATCNLSPFTERAHAACAD